MDRELTYIFDKSDDNLQSPVFIEELRNVFKTVQTFSQVEAGSYFDTFDLRLLKKKITLFKNTSKLYSLKSINSSSYDSLTCKENYDECLKDKLTFNDFFNRNSSTTRGSFKINFKSNPIEFWGDFPGESLQNKFKSILSIRKLIPVSTLEIEKKYYNILNKDEKTVVKILSETYYINQNKNHFIETITIRSIRGYDKFYDKLKLFLFEQKFLKEISKVRFLQIIIKAGNRVPVKYSAKPAAITNPKQSSGQALLKILISLLKIIRINEKGIILDIDTEFLHDYRIAIRKTRSILGQLKNVFNEKELQLYREGFAELAGSTNTLRDYDVYLLNKENYQSILPDYLYRGLDHFFAQIQLFKKSGHKKLIRKLYSQNYLKFIVSWEEALNNNQNIFNGADADLPIIEIAKDCIFNRYNKIIKRGKNIYKDSPDSELHELRLHCKKLRYLMELFSGLFPLNDIKILIVQLKKLQDCLGNFNDYSIQQIHFEDYLGGIKITNQESIELSAAIGALITASFQEKIKMRNDFLNKFNAFTDDSNTVLFMKLFKIYKQTNKKESMAVCNYTGQDQ